MPLYSGLEAEMHPGPDTSANEQERAMEEIEAEIVARDLPSVIPMTQTSIVRASIGDVTEAILEYTRIKDALDRALPDCMQTIRGKQFRKKNYWRAVATAFNLTVENTKETLDESAESGAWGYLVMYRATAPNGRFADGDGACYASEKTAEQATVHNVRGHAHTRAYNRAVSNLVGFGEVSAEEMQHESAGRGGSSKAHGASSGGDSRGAIRDPRPVDDLISEAQVGRLWAIWSATWERECPALLSDEKEKKACARNVLGSFGYTSSKKVRKADYDRVVSALEKWTPPDAQPADPSWDAQP